MTRPIADYSPEEIRAEIRDVVGQVLGFHDWEMSQHFLQPNVLLPAEQLETCPLGECLAEIFAHVRGETEVEHIREDCQTVADALFASAGRAYADSMYDIPARFWASLTGRAIRLAIGDALELDPAELVGLDRAAEIAAVGRSKLYEATQRGEIPTAGEGKGEAGRSGVRYRVGDVRAWAQDQAPSIRWKSIYDKAVNGAPLIRQERDLLDAWWSGRLTGFLGIKLGLAYGVAPDVRMSPEHMHAWDIICVHTQDDAAVVRHYGLVPLVVPIREIS